MTSQLAIFNSMGVAVASDTVATVTSGNHARKTISNARKILLLGR